MFLYILRYSSIIFYCNNILLIQGIQNIALGHYLKISEKHSLQFLVVKTVLACVFFLFDTISKDNL